LAQEYFLFIGTYTNAKPDKGIYVYKFNSDNGSLTLLNSGQNIINPSYLTIHPNGKFIYACTETQMNDNGNVSAFAFDKNNGSLKLLNKVSSGGDNPCYVSVHHSGKWLTTANYSGSSAAVSAIKENGSLEPPTQILRFKGSSTIKNRQEKAHIHSSVFSPDNDFIYFSDLGSDKIWGYPFHSSEAKPINEEEVQETEFVSGSGPRHFTFHPRKKFAYSIEELSGMVSVFSYKKGELKSIQRIAAHGDQTKGPYGSADIHISQDSKFLYCSNRGNENTISIFSIQRNGELSLVGIQSTLGVHPRNFMIDPTGRYLLVANQHSNHVVVFKRNKITGLISPTGIEVSVPRPSCLQMMKAD
jgi:6-phosphogluconolactonase (cycloisomerase 2 family)